MPLTIKPKQDCSWDLVALGEVMLRFDPGDKRVATARSFDVYEGGGEYNVARGLKRCFGLDTAIVTAFADNPVGRLLQDLIFQGGVDQSLVRWALFDGVGRAVRNGLNFTERDSARARRWDVPTAATRPFRSSSPARSIGTPSSAGTAPAGSTPAAFFAPFPNPRPPWPSRPSRPRAATGWWCPTISTIAPRSGKPWRHAEGARGQPAHRAAGDVMIGNEEDFSAALGFEVPESTRA